MRMQIYFGPRNTFSKSNFKIVFRIGVFVYTMSRFLCQLSHIEDDFSKCQNTEITKYCNVISGLCFSNWFAAVGGGGGKCKTNININILLQCYGIRIST